MKIIIINGSAKSGKDKFVKFFREVSGLRIKNFSSIDKVKSISELCFGWDGKKDDKSRKFLSDIKRIWSQYNDGPTKDILNKIETDKQYCIDNNKDINKNIYFLHIREPNEIKKIKDNYNNCITLLIRKDVIVPDNDSDKNVENYDYDYTIYNNGSVDDLKNESLKFFEKIKES